MLSLPQKPWRRVRIVRQAEDRYTVTFVSPLRSQEEFDAVVLEDLEGCLGAGDRLGDASWATRSVSLTTRDIVAFERRLIMESIAVEDA